MYGGYDSDGVWHVSFLSYQPSTKTLCLLASPPVKSIKTEEARPFIFCIDDDIFLFLRQSRSQNVNRYVRCSYDPNRHEWVRIEDKWAADTTADSSDKFRFGSQIFECTSTCTWKKFTGEWYTCFFFGAGDGVVTKWCVPGLEQHDIRSTVERVKASCLLGWTEQIAVSVPVQWKMWRDRPKVDEETVESEYCESSDSDDD